MKTPQGIIGEQRMIRVDKKVLEAILSAFDSEDVLLLPEDVELDELQEQFIRGYLCAQKEESGEFGTDEERIRQQILQVRSKYCEPLLEFLFQEGELYHGDLAEKLELSPSGLNAIIKKMMESDPPIIAMMQIGKYKIYSLPEAVKRYMENRSRSKVHEEEKTRTYQGNILLTLQHFVEAAGESWKDVLNLMLQGEEPETDKRVIQSFRELTEQARQAQENDSDSYEVLKRAVRNDILLFLLDEYVEEMKECELIMEEIRQRKNGKRLIRHFKMR